MVKRCSGNLSRQDIMALSDPLSNRTRLLFLKVLEVWIPLEFGAFEFGATDNWSSRAFEFGGTDEQLEGHLTRI